MASQKEAASLLDRPLPFPEDPSMTYMTQNVEEKVSRPPGVTSLRQWGSMVMPEGKHKTKSFMEVVTQDPEYSRWMVKHPGLRSDWAVSFQNFVKAWNQSQGHGQSMQLGARPKMGAVPKKNMELPGWSDEEELILIEEGHQKPLMPVKNAGKLSSSQGKRMIHEEKEEDMQADVNQELVAQLRLQIALLQDQLAQVVKNTTQ